MKRSFFALLVLFLFVFGATAWGVCPEDTLDRGECDTMYVEPWPADLIPGSDPPYFVRVPIFVTNDLADVYDSILGFTIPLCYTHSNPSKYCSLSSWWNRTSVGWYYPDFNRSIFRHMVEGTDTLYYNRMADMAADFSGREWDCIILHLGDGVNHFWLSMIPMGTPDQLWWEGSRVLLATMTFKLEETMSICIDTCLWPPVSRLAWAIKPEGGGEAISKIPRPGTGTSSFEVCFNVQPTEYIRVTSPAGGEEWCVGSIYDITWDCFEIENVKIEYSTNGGSTWMTIVASTPCATGSYSWTIPDTPSANCLVRICDTGDNDPCGTSDGVFTIVPQTILCISPGGGENWCAGSVHNITWASSCITSVKIQYTTNGGASWISIVASTPSDGSYSWWIPNTSSANCRIKICDAADGDPCCTSDVFTIIPEAITVTAPNGGEVWYIDSVYSITWYSQCLSTVRIEYSTNGGASWMTIAASTASDGSYFWSIPNTSSANCRVEICDAADNNPCDQSDNSFTIGLACVFPTHFLFRDSTVDSYSIVIDSAFLDGLELEECDEIGVFDDTGGGKGLLCVGASVYHPNDLPIPLTAWKDDPQTAVKDGYTPGHTMYFRVWSRNQGREEDALAHYSVGNGHFESGVYSQLWLEAPHPCEDIALYSGWQWVSTNIDPDPCEMESVFVNCWDDLGIIIACDGSFCIPGVGCWIDCWKVCEMYKLHMAAACTIEVCGSKVPTDKPCPLPAGWNCIAYFPECPLEPETALVSIWDNLDIVQNDAGEFCIPGVGCWIDCMEYNEGYKIHLSSADTLVYPINCPPCPPPFAKKKSFPGFARTTHLNYSRNTGESYSIVVNSVELDGKHPEVGDEIGVFMPSGLCVGGGVWRGDILGIAVWQDDDRTEVVDGFQVGEQMVFKLWDKTENKEIELFASFEKGDGRFGTDAYALVSLKGISSQLPERFELAQNYPNPFNPETKISYALPKDCHVKLTIYNMLGQKIKVLVDEHQTAGHKNVHWDGKDYKGNEVASGIYFFRIEAGDLTQSKKMVILK